MKKLIVRYKVKADKADENEKLIRKVFEELHKNRPDGLRYASFKLSDGVSFVHVVIEHPGGANVSLNDVPAFRAFTENIGERCDEPPVAMGATVVGAHGLVS